MALDAVNKGVISAYIEQVSIIVPFVCYHEHIDANVEMTRSARSIDFTFRLLKNISEDFIEMSLDFEFESAGCIVASIALCLTNGDIVAKFSENLAPVNFSPAFWKLVSDALVFLRQKAFSVRSERSAW